MKVDDLNTAQAESIIESLRGGLPPKRFASTYSVGYEQFLAGVRRRLLEAASDRGRIRFISGSWGSGKTHFMRLLREEALNSDYLVSTVELSAQQTPFNKFEQVLYAIIRNIASPQMYEQEGPPLASPFGGVLEQALLREAGDGDIQVAFERCKTSLFDDDSIDIDVRRVVAAYWATFTAGDADSAILQDTRGLLMQWFEGAGTATVYRKQFNVMKMVDRTNARIILQSISALIRHLGYRGLVILFDESEMTHSTMRKSNLKQAHNNLLHLINEIEGTPGVLLVYAAVPEFFIDDRVGIKIYGALAQRIGQPKDKAPIAVDTVWNIDEIANEEEQFEEAAARIRSIYLKAYPDLDGELVNDDDFHGHVRGLLDAHPEFSRVSTWRVVITGAVELLDHLAEGIDPQDPETHHADIMKILRDE